MLDRKRRASVIIRVRLLQSESKITPAQNSPRRQKTTNDRVTDLLPRRSFLDPARPLKPTLRYRQFTTASTTLALLRPPPVDRVAHLLVIIFLVFILKSLFECCIRL